MIFYKKNETSQISDKVHEHAKKRCPIKENFNNFEKSSSILLKEMHKKLKNVHQKFEKKFTNSEKVHHLKKTQNLKKFIIFGKKGHPILKKSSSN